MTAELTKAAQQALEALRNAQQLEHLVDRKMQRAAIAALERALTQRPAAQEVHPLASRCYAMSEPHLSGYRLVLGFETLEAVDAAHTWVANVRKAPRQATLAAPQATHSPTKDQPTAEKGNHD